MTPPEPRRDVAREQRCRALEIAAVLGAVLALFSVLDRVWPAVAIGVAGTVLALVVRHRVCRAEARSSE